MDYHRGIRKGFPEVIFCPGKTKEEILTIMQKLATEYPNILATRANEEIYELVKSSLPDARYHPEARAIFLEREPREKKGKIALVSAGTSDLPIAEEAALTAEIAGSKVERIFDVGIAGLHRLLPYLPKLWEANVIIAVAGMEGALPGLLAGLVNRPIIAVPTSTGYGANLRGITPLLTMLNSCSPGVAVVNIDNGFGAGFLAHMINQLAEGVR
ncbi:nickel pincer cofactor biosynthesis protein LarB [Candidatus Sordicultor fermentans]|uniref:nickel pincer cofactor biosynthesis protein LarB n=1 Tax=Candidatus Sordicultor fermentans TaxID=1953203 RepID=UPI003908B3F8